jgi:cytochrome c553
MRMVAGRLKPEQIRALAAYYASLPSERRPDESAAVNR